jgi:selenocysteine lyase/cysteine desulfurase
MNQRVTRRRFLGSSVTAAIGGLTAGSLAPARAQTPGPSAAPASVLDALRTTGTPDEAYWRMVRREFNISDGLTYMNTGTLGPMPRHVVDANVRYLRQIAEDPHALPDTEGVRAAVARFINATPDEIVLTRSTTEGMKIFTHGLDLKEGDEVVMSSHEHPGGYGAWRNRAKRHGIKIVEVAIPAPPESADQIVSLFERAMTPRTRVLMVSHIVYVTGLVNPLKPLADLAHRRGLLFSVDAAHALGMLPLDVRAYDADHYSAAGQKWLMAGTGTGVAYFRSGIQDRVWADMVGNQEPKGARKYERSGQRDIPSALGIGDALDFQLAIGKPNVENRVKQLARRFKEGLREIPGATLYTSMSPELSGGLTTFSIRDVPKQNVAKFLMEERGIWIPQSGLNANSCRASTHIYTLPSDVDRLLEALRYLAANSSKFTTTAN